jgi:hypothetical protein
MKTPKHWTSAAVYLATAALFAACGGETATPDACPPQAEYDIRELYASESQQVVEERAAIEAMVDRADAEGCVTKPRFTPRLDDVSPSQKRALALELQRSDADAGTAP